MTKISYSKFLKKRILLPKVVFLLAALLAFIALAFPLQAQMKRSDNKPGEVSGSSILNVDYRNLISRSDLLYDQPVSRSEEGQPIGNGRMGSLVWTIPSALKLQINRVDIFGNNAYTNNFYERNTDYCGGAGFVDLGFGDAVFTAPDYRQQLSCYDALSTVTGKGLQARVLAWHEQDVMAVQVHDSRQVPAPVAANLRMLRMPVSKRGNHTATSKLTIVKDRIVLTQEFKEDDYYCGSAVAIGLVGRKARAELANETTGRLSALAGSPSYTLYIASAASFDPKEDLVAAAMQKLDAATARGFDGLYASNQEWWHAFWEKAFVHLSSADGEAGFIEANYNYYLYTMASSSRGDYPTKFNGMLWNTGGDARKWGATYWGANQSCLYNALFQTNRLDLMDPMYRMYTNAFPAFETAARQEWGSKGIYIPETHSFDGPPELPEAIASEMRDLYLIRKPWEERTKSFDDYAHTKLSFLSLWNWKKDEGWVQGRWHSTDKGGGPYGHVTHIFSRGAKIAYQYWLKYEYTQDEKWLREEAYPMLKGMAEFYRTFPNIRKEADGKYHMYHVNDNEAVWGAHNPVEEISSMHGVFPAVIRASEILKVDADLRTAWKEFHQNLSPLVLNTDYPEQASSKEVVWYKALSEPAVVQGSPDRRPDPNTMPVWFFDLCTLEADPQTLQIANATFDSFFPQGINSDTRMNVLSKLAAAGTLLGREEATKFLIPNQLRTAETEVMANRMDLREGYQTTSVQRLGRAADALHYALNQSVPKVPGEQPVIRVFPAWPREWDAQYTLLARGGFLVTSSMKNGAVEFVEITSQAGETCHLRNPWDKTAVTVYRNGKKLKDLNDSLITFKTSKNDRFTIVPKGASPTQFKRTLLAHQ